MALIKSSLKVIAPISYEKILLKNLTSINYLTIKKDINFYNPLHIIDFNYTKIIKFI